MRESINKCQWYVRGVLPHIPIGGKLKRSLDAYYVTDRIEATVPGGIHYDLFRAGIIENPYYADNSMKCEWTEHRWWLYETDVRIQTECGRKIYLVFDGLDYAADIFVNDELVGSHENMFTRARIDITDIALSETNIKVLFKGVPQELGQYGKTSMTFTQKSRFGYGWDFATRLVNIGIWKDVWVEYSEDVELAEAHISSDYADGKGILRASFALNGTTEEMVTLSVFSPEGELIAQNDQPYAETISGEFVVEDPALWYPNGMGAHPLYKVGISCGAMQAEYRTGIRSLRYRQNEGAPEDSLPYTIWINDQRVQVKGNNKVPFDHLYGNVSHQTYEWYVRALVNENVNIVRVWGGGIIETELFYDLCDENGILIWQDFIQSSSGVENVPSKKSEFLEKLQDAATEAVKEKRNHVSMTIWCGGNELTDEADIPATYEDANIAMLKEIVDRDDPERLFVPSTPSGPVYRLDFDNPANQDVHGPWGYLGKKTHYENYNRLKLMLHSELGISAPSADLSDFMRADVLQEPEYIKRRHHGGFWWHSYEDNQELFGTFDTYRDYVLYGQWIQAEGLRYTIESDQRLGKYNSGTMIWQLNEPWPNSDCTNLVDYFGTPKMAYYWVKKAYAECGVSLKYDGLVTGEQFRAVLCRDSGEAPAGIQVSYHTMDGTCFGQEEYLPEALPVILNCDIKDAGEMFFVRVSAKGICKDYFFSKKEQTSFAAARRLSPARLTASITETGCEGAITTIRATVQNTGTTAALFVHPYDTTGQYAVLADDAYVTLLPGEEMTVTMAVRKKLGLFFDRTDAEPQIAFRALNG